MGAGRRRADVSRGSSWPAAVSLIPLAGVIGLGTEELAERSGPALGGFLNATFGNAAELIIAVVALGQGHVELVKASISGQHHRQPAARARILVLHRRTWTALAEVQSHGGDQHVTSMLFLAVVALVMPAVFDLTLYGTLEARPPAIDRLSLGTAIVLIVAYIGSLVYAFTARARSVPANARPITTSTSGITTAAAIGLLAVGTVLTTVQAELLVGTLEPALKQFGFTELFVGVVVVAIIGNAAEHYSAIAAARRDQMTLAVEISVGSSAQIALLVAPAVILYSFAIGASDVAHLQSVRDQRDRAVGARHLDGRRRRREQLGRGASAHLGVRDHRARVLFHPVTPDGSKPDSSPAGSSTATAGSRFPSNGGCRRVRISLR